MMSPDLSPDLSHDLSFDDIFKKFVLLFRSADQLIGGI